MRHFLLILALLFGVLFQLFANDYSFQVQVEGTGQPVLFIPGLGCSGEAWDETVAEFSKNYECHVFTFPGFAGQPAQASLKEDYLKTMRDQLIQYVQTNKIVRPTLVGHSLGGFLSLWIATTSPDLVEKIVIVDAYPFYSAAMNPMVTMEMATKQAKMMKTMMVNQTDEIFETQQKQFVQTMVSKPEKASEIVKWSIASNRATIAQAMYELMTTDLRPEVAKATCPILVLGAWYGGKDFGLTEAIVKSTFQDQYKLSKNCRIEMAPTARHFIMFDEPQWFYDQLHKFLK